MEIRCAGIITVILAVILLGSCGTEIWKVQKGRTNASQKPNTTPKIPNSSLPSSPTTNNPQTPKPPNPGTTSTQPPVQISPPNPPQSATCLVGPGNITKVSGSFTSAYTDSLVSGEKIDSSSASWGLKNYPNQTLRISGSENNCWHGGSIDSGLPWTVDWSTAHDTYGFLVKGGNNFVIEWLRVSNTGDGISIDAIVPNVTIRDVYLENTHDDCIENDFGNNLLLERVACNGTYMGISTRPYSTTSSDSATNLVTIRDSLIYLHDQPLGYGGKTNTHMFFFKWDTGTPSRSPKLSLHRNIFRTDSAGQSPGRMGIPAGRLQDCTDVNGAPDNTMVWLGSGSYPAPTADDFYKCFKIVTDKSIWDKALNDFKIGHGIP